MPTRTSDGARKSKLPDMNIDRMKVMIRLRDANIDFHWHEDAVAWWLERIPKNEEESSVIMKAAIIDDLYRTRVGRYFNVAGLILNSGLDTLLEQGKPEAVDAISHGYFNGNDVDITPFASRYCHWHRPEAYPMLDPVVKEVMWRYRAMLPHKPKRKKDLDTYAGFCATLRDFQTRFGFEEFDWRQMDKGLWMIGVESMGIVPPA